MAQLLRRLVTQVRDFLTAPARGEIVSLAVDTRAILHRQLLASERYADPRCLTRHGYRCFSQNDEDGIIEEIFRRIGTTNRQFVEFGVETGVENNTVTLLVRGWSGLWIEASSRAVAAIHERFRDALHAGRLRVAEAFVTAEAIEGLLEGGGVPAEPDLLSVDIDGNDYWVWKAIQRFRPRVVVIEYNATLGRMARLVQPYEPRSTWNGTSGFGASLAALAALGREKGYALVGCNLTGVNAFFVRTDCCGEHFLEPSSVDRHFEPARFGATGAGHPLWWRRFEEV